MSSSSDSQLLTPPTGARVVPIASPRRPSLVKVLIVDDDRIARECLTQAIKMMGCRVDTAIDVESAMARVRADSYDFAFCDLCLGDESGVELLPKLLAVNPNLQVVVITAFASYETAVKAIKAGAIDYLPKPFEPAQAAALLRQTIETNERAHSMSEFEQRLHDVIPELSLDSLSPAMKTAHLMIARAAQSDVPVLLRGESGSGKGVFARALHVQSQRAKKPFVTVNCPSLTDELLSSDLFGHIKGAFTGAIRDQAGKVEAADGGTLFLDEFGDLSANVQAKLLRFLQEHRYERLGDTETRTANVRIIAATNRPLETHVSEGRFREDLLFRLNVIEILLPPLRERRDDIPGIARSLLDVFTEAANRPPMELSPAALELLLRYDWPGNVRELRNEIQRITVLWPSRIIEREAFSQRIHRNAVQGPRLGGSCSLQDIESEHIRQVLSRSNSFDEAARILGIEPSTLWRKRRRMGL